MGLMRSWERQVPRAFAHMRLPGWLSNADWPVASQGDGSPCCEPACEACPAGLLPHLHGQSFPAFHAFSSSAAPKVSTVPRAHPGPSAWSLGAFSLEGVVVVVGGAGRCQATPGDRVGTGLPSLC